VKVDLPVSLESASQAAQGAYRDAYEAILRKNGYLNPDRAPLDVHIFADEAARAAAERIAAVASHPGADLVQGIGEPAPSAKAPKPKAAKPKAKAPVNETRYAPTTSQMAFSPGPDPSIAALLRRLAAHAPADEDDDEHDDDLGDERERVLVLDVFGTEPKPRTSKTYGGADPMALTVDLSAIDVGGPEGIVLGEPPTAREKLIRRASIPPELARQLPDETLRAIAPTFSSARKAGVSWR
jgi:hypothetical protein